MKKSIAIIFTALLIITASTLSAQTVRMTNQQTAREYAVENRATTVLPLIQKADRQIRSLKYMEAMLTLDNAVGLNPYSAEALLLRARVKKIMGMRKEAQEDFSQAYRLNPYVGNLYGYPANSSVVGIMDLESENAVQKMTTDQKLNYYYYALDNMALDTETTNEQMVEIERVLRYLETENIEDSQTLLDSILIKYPGSAIAHDLRGSLYLKEGKTLAALDAFSKAVLIEPEFAIAWYNLAQVERQLGHLEKAKTYLDKAISLQEGLTKAYFERAVLSKKLGDPESALEDYERVIDMNGKNYMEAYINRGLTKKMLGDYNGAITDIEQAIKEFPDQPELYKNRGNLNLIFGLQRNAIDDYSRAIKLDANYAEAYYNRAIAFFQLFDRISACADLDKSIELGYERAVEMKGYLCGE
ncbi:MAG: tetratricopeptide repeat protein [Saprospiraceae bacterium]